MSRFNLGDIVRVRSIIFSQHAKALGRIAAVLPHKSGKETLNRYTVEFNHGARVIFWSIQLEHGPACSKLDSKDESDQDSNGTDNEAR